MIQETAQVTDDLIRIKTADKSIRLSKTLPKNNSEINRKLEEIVRQIYMYLYHLDLSDSNEIQTDNHFIHKRTLNHLAKLAI